MTTDEICRHEMSRANCSYCSPRPVKLLARKTNDSSRTFAALYDGYCRHCGDDFEQGEQIGYVHHEICCEDCVFDS